jgi:hypothetical protein
MEADADGSVAAISTRIAELNLTPTERTKEVTRKFSNVEVEVTNNAKSLGECNAMKAYLAAIAKRLDKTFGSALSKKYIVVPNSDEYFSKAYAGFYRSLNAGSKVMSCNANRVALYGLVVETKKPIAYIQWENQNIEPRMAWVQISSLLPPFGGPSNKVVTENDILQEARRRNNGSVERAIDKVAKDATYRQTIYRDLIADEQCQ